MNDKLVEALASYAHHAWSGWMRYLFDKSTKQADGSVVIPADLVARWDRQTFTSYEDLPDNEQESDRHEARTILSIIAEKTEASQHELLAEVRDMANLTATFYETLCTRGVPASTAEALASTWIRASWDSRGDEVEARPVEEAG